MKERRNTIGGWRMEEEIKVRKSIGGAGFEDGGGGGDVKASQAVLSCFVNQAAVMIEGP